MELMGMLTISDKSYHLLGIPFPGAGPVRIVTAIFTRHEPGRGVHRGVFY